MPLGITAGSKVVTETRSNHWSESGYEFEAGVVVDMAIGATYYVGFEVPSESVDRFVALQTRFFKSDFAKVDLEILWDTASITGGSNVPIYNNHRAQGRTSDVVFTANATVDETGSQVRERDFIGGALGQGNTQTSSGQIPAETGFRIYRAGEHFVVKLVNNSGEVNKVKVGYLWAEPPIELLEGV